MASHRPVLPFRRRSLRSRRGFRPAIAGLALALIACFFGCAESVELPPAEPQCGDGLVEGSEICDDGPANSDTEPDACRLNCTPPICADGVKDAAEECDDGNLVDGDGCDANCVKEWVCGDNICEIQKGESCSECGADCCVCGDGTCDTSFGETCDMCPSECCPDCGNGVIDASEECDDGNNAAGDGCSAGCVDEDGQQDCGNGVLEAGEACDDGNATAMDGCSPACEIEFVCGDGTCDAAAGETCMNCVPDCCPDCGNGVIDAGEECDTTDLNGLTCTGACYPGGTLSCTPYCTYDYSTCTGTLPMCGDGIANPCGEECDGADFMGASCAALGFAGGALSCTAGCTIDTSGCAPVTVYLQENFDNGCPPAGWTLGGDWQCGTPTGQGPGAAYSAPACLGTQIAGLYNANQAFTTAVVTTPSIDLTGATVPIWSMRTWVDTEGFTYDGYNLKISTNGGATYSLLNTVSPAYDLTVGGEPAWGGHFAASGWQEVSADLSAYAGQTVMLRIAFRSDGSVQYPGVYIDDMKVSEAIVVPTPYMTSFEGAACAPGWELNGDWQCGVPTSGPNAAYDGLQCIATQLAGNYSSAQTWVGATSPILSLAGVSSGTLSFRMWVRTEGSFDGMNLKISANGGPYQTVTAVPAYNTLAGGENVWGGDMSASGWQFVSADLAPFANQNIKIRFAFYSDFSNELQGVYVDSVMVQ